MQHGTFLQSRGWEQFQQRVGHTTRRVGEVLVIEHQTPVGRYWYVGRPMLTPAVLEAIAAAARDAKVLFVRIDPAPGSEVATLAGSRLTKPTQPQDTLVLDLRPDADTILKSFHEKTRYNLRLAQRKGVQIEESADPEHRAFRAFIELGKRTGNRQGIRYGAESYYRQMLESLQGDGLTASVVVAHWQNRPLAANVMLWAGGTAYYLHGASWHEHRQFMAPHLLQWHCIQQAKQRGATAYDFWGIAPLNEQRELVDPKHAWAGITRFKLGFGGEVVHAPDSFDLVLEPAKYTLYAVGRRLRRSLGRAW